jgi:hypothetical protein
MQTVAERLEGGGAPRVKQRKVTLPSPAPAPAPAPVTVPAAAPAASPALRAAAPSEATAPLLSHSAWRLPRRLPPRPPLPWLRTSLRSRLGLRLRRLWLLCPPRRPLLPHPRLCQAFSFGAPAVGTSAPLSFGAAPAPAAAPEAKSETKAEAAPRPWQGPFPHQKLTQEEGPCAMDILKLTAQVAELTKGEH